MSDDKSAAGSGETPSSTPSPILSESDPGANKAPEVFVRGGGTHTTEHDKLFARLHADAERRRAQDDYERAISTPGEKSRVPVQDGGAVRYSNYLTECTDIEEAHVLLRYLTPGGEQAFGPGGAIHCVADIKVGDDPTNMMLVFFCQRCLERGSHAEECIIHVSQKHRHWELSLKGMGSTFEFDGRLYKSAGTVMDSDLLRCNRCGWAVHIDNNCVRPER